MMNDEELLLKYQSLKKWLNDKGSLAVAFSGGVDSVFLMHAASESLGEKSAAFTARTTSFTSHELEECRSFCDRRKIPLHIVDFDQFSIPGFEKNPRDRCYICKKAIFGMLKDHAVKSGFAYVADGTNADDVGEYRPGMKALAELGIESPLRDLGFRKAEIRRLSEIFGLEGWNRGSFACLATRFETGADLSYEKLRRVENCENFLRGNGFLQYRVRVYETGAAGKMLARIEVTDDDIRRVADMRSEIEQFFRSEGFDFVTLDLCGFRSGSMN